MSDRPPRIGKFLTPGRAVLLALGALLVAFLLASYLTGAQFAAEVEAIKRRGEPVRVSELLPKLPPGQQNAAEVYEQAFAVAPSPQDIASVSVYPGQWNPQQEADAARLVATHRDYYELLDEASRLAVCVFPINYDRGFIGGQPYLNYLGNAGEALAAKARVEALQGDLDGAARTWGTLLRLAEHERQSPLWLDLRDSLSCHWAAATELPHLLARGDPSPAVCRTLASQFAKPDWQAAFTRSLQADRANWLAVLARAERGGLSGGSRDLGVLWDTAIHPLVARPWYNADKETYLRVAAGQIEASQKPWVQASRELEEGDEEQERALASSRFYVVAALSHSSCASRHRYVTRAAAQDGAAQIALALTVYHHDHGDYPASLAELTRAGWKLPLDPFTGKPYHYRREGKGFAVWSVGPDLTDNHATAYDPASSREDQPGYDYVFRCAR